MRNKLMSGFAGAVFTSIVASSSAMSATLDDVMARLDKLEKENQSIKKENTELRERMRTIEAKRSSPAAPTHAVVGSTTPQTTLASGHLYNANLPIKSPPAPVLPPIAYNWSGFYIGGNVGGGWGQTSFADNSLEGWVNSTFSAMNITSINGCDFCGILPGVSPSTAKVDPTGWVAGVQGGYMHQFGNIVLGVDGEWDWTSLKGTATSVASANPNVNLACVNVDGVACIGNVNDAFNVNTKWT